jgi:hypothetical protein
MSAAAFICRSLLAGDSKAAATNHVLNRLQAGSYRGTMLAAVCFLLGLSSAVAAPWVDEKHHAGDFPLVHDGQAALLCWSADDFKVVRIAGGDLQQDIERVTGQLPVIELNPAKLSGPAVLIGTLGRSPLIDGLVASGKLDAQELHGAWESFIITTVADPLPGVPSALVIAGSDRRGTAFGVYELSQAIGVSPWYWWADVTPAKKAALSVAAGTRRFGPPSVQYRGIFLNDEDWGLQPWAAKTFEPEVGDIGPKTYAKICELLLRLKANTLWPAMHACTKAFNLYPQNKVVADDYAIVMGSSHAEPMLRNNVTEWTAPHEQYNYLTNRDGVRAYWEQRVEENGQYENIYTLGMRGIHDSNMLGPKTDAERIATLEQIFADQREMLARHARWNPASGRVGLDASAGNASGGRVPPEQIPQMFCAYKEVLSLYQQGLKVPDDVTIVWPDDNFGYIRNYASAEEQKRRGGFGVYYHISYLGAPLSYLWLETTPPALIWEEMSKAYDHGARKIWIVNVGDLKPAEIGTEFFLQLAWDIKRWRHDNVQDFLSAWAAREFGEKSAEPVAGALKLYYQLNFQRRPEHLQWWLPKEPARPSGLSAVEVYGRLNRFGTLQAMTDRARATLPKEKITAFDELVGYPVRVSTLANNRYFNGELGRKKEALTADTELKTITRRFNEELAGGKWRGLMSAEPADDQWKSFRIAPWQQPAFPAAVVVPDKSRTIGAEQFQASVGTGAARWEQIPGLGAALFPTTAAAPDETRLATEAPRLGCAQEFPAAGDFECTIYLLPTHPLVPARGLRLALGLDEAAPQPVTCLVKDGSPEWGQGVLNNYVTVTARLSVPKAGKHELRIYGVDAGVVLIKVGLAAAVKP